MTIERRYSGSFDVYKPCSFGGGQMHIDTVFYSSATVDEVRRGLIGHDGYDSDIIVTPSGDIIALTDAELEEICEDNEVRLVQATEPEVAGRWDWLQDDAGNASDMSFAEKREAMLDAVERLELDTYDERESD